MSSSLETSRTVAAQNENACPECGDEIQEGETEAWCDSCGLVVDEYETNYGPDWRNFEDVPDKERAAPGNRNLPGRGMGSEVGHQCERDKQTERMNRWHKQAQAGDKKDRNRAYATSEIQRLGSALELGDSLIKQAKNLFRQLHDAGEVLGRDMDTICATCVYSTARIHQRGLTTDEVAAVARADAKLIARRHTWLCNQLGLQVPPPDPTQRIRIAGNELGAGSQDINRAIWLCERAPEDRQSRGKPSTLAAACLYEADAGTQRECADAAGVTASALRNRLSDVPEMDGL